MKSQLVLGNYCADDIPNINLKHFRITYFESSPKELPPQTIFELIERKGFDLKRNSNSYLKLIKSDNLKLVLKEPTRKNRRFLTRILSVFRQSRAYHVAQSLTFLRSAEIETNRPLCVLEKRFFGMVVYSLIIYEYIEGEAIQSEHFADLAETVKKINNLGYGHNDCHQGNFIKTHHGISPIDVVLRKHFFGKISVDLQFLKLFHALTETELMRLYPGANQKRLRFSRWLFNVKRQARSIKNTLKPYLYSCMLVSLAYQLVFMLNEGL